MSEPGYVQPDYSLLERDIPVSVLSPAPDG